MHLTLDPSQPRTATASVSGRAARRVTLAATVACIVLLGIFLLRGHIAGGEVIGPVAAFVGIVAGGLTLASGGARRRSLLIAVVTLWTAVVVLGITGTYDHTRPVRPASTDPRPRPAYVPLVFSLIGGAGIVAVVRTPGRRAVALGSPDDTARREHAR
jgi:hypothetical protein